MCKYCKNEAIVQWALEDEDGESNLLFASYGNGKISIGDENEELEIEFDFCPMCGTKIVR